MNKPIIGAVIGAGTGAVLLAVLATLAANVAEVTTPTTRSTATMPAEKEFLAVMKAKCVRCHRIAGDIEAMAKTRWLKPGDPEGSTVYTSLNKAKKPGGKYHDVTAQEKTTIHDFVIGYKFPTSRPSTRPTSAAARP